MTSMHIALLIILIIREAPALVGFMKTWLCVLKKVLRFLLHNKINVLFHLPYQQKRYTLEFRNNCQKKTSTFVYTL